MLCWVTRSARCGSVLDRAIELADTQRACLTLAKTTDPGRFVSWFGPPALLLGAACAAEPDIRTIARDVWLPEHGYSFSSTPLWAGIALLPLSAGFLIAGRLADHHGARPFATGGMIAAAASFLLLIVLPVNFPYWAFALIIALNGLSMGLFAAPNQTGIMNSLPPDQRGAGAGMAGTFMNSAGVLSIGIFFSLIIIGLSSTLGPALYHGLASNGVPHSYAVRVSHLPPVGTLFAAFLGYNPTGTLLGPVIHQLPHHTAAYLTGHRFFPSLVSHPFRLWHPPGVLLRRRLLRRGRDRLLAARRQVLPPRRSPNPSSSAQISPRPSLMGPRAPRST